MSVGLVQVAGFGAVIVLFAAALFVIFLIPIVDKMVRIGLRTVSQAVPPQEIITRDYLPARVDAVIYFRVVDPKRSVFRSPRLR